MNHLKTTLSIILIGLSSLVSAQKSNAEKIIGCWMFETIEFPRPELSSEQIIEQAKDAVVCFDENGRFSTTLSGKSQPALGSYTILADGKTMVQVSDSANEQSDIDSETDNEEKAEIVLLDDKRLSLKGDFGTMHFKRK